MPAVPGLPVGHPVRTASKARLAKEITWKESTTCVVPGEIP